MVSSIDIGNFKLKLEHLSKVIEHMESGLNRSVSDQEAIKFLSEHSDILANIVGYDEVETSDRYSIWDHLKAEQN